MSETSGSTKQFIEQRRKITSPDSMAAAPDGANVRILFFKEGRLVDDFKVAKDVSAIGKAQKEADRAKKAAAKPAAQVQQHLDDIHNKINDLVDMQRLPNPPAEHDPRQYELQVRELRRGGSMKIGTATVKRPIWGKGYDVTSEDGKKEHRDWVEGAVQGAFYFAGFDYPADKIAEVVDRVKHRQTKRSRGGGGDIGGGPADISSPIGRDVAAMEGLYDFEIIDRPGFKVTQLPDDPKLRPAAAKKRAAKMQQGYRRAKQHGARSVTKPHQHHMIALRDNELFTDQYASQPWLEELGREEPTWSQGYNQGRDLKGWADKLGMSVDEYKAAVDSALREALSPDRVKVSTRVPVNKLNRILTEGVQSQYQTGRSKGHFDPALRASFEAEFFGKPGGERFIEIKQEYKRLNDELAALGDVWRLPPSDPKWQRQREIGNEKYALMEEREKLAQAFAQSYTEDPSDVPVYGYVGATDERMWRDGKDETVLDLYGTARLVLKDSVRQKTSFTMGDSLDATGRAQVVRFAAQPIDAPTWRAGYYGVVPPEGANYEGYEPLRDLANPSRTFEPTWNDYVEAQIHGGIDPSEIERVVFKVGGNLPDGGKEIKPPAKGLLNKLEKMGIPYEMHHADGTIERSSYGFDEPPETDEPAPDIPDYAVDLPIPDEHKPFVTPAESEDYLNYATQSPLEVYNHLLFDGKMNEALPPPDDKVMMERERGLALARLQRRWRYRYELSQDPEHTIDEAMIGAIWDEKGNVKQKLQAMVEAAQAAIVTQGELKKGDEVKVVVRPGSVPRTGNVTGFTRDKKSVYVRFGSFAGKYPLESIVRGPGLQSYFENFMEAVYGENATDGFHAMSRLRFPSLDNMRGAAGRASHDGTVELGQEWASPFLDWMVDGANEIMTFTAFRGMRTAIHEAGHLSLPEDIRQLRMERSYGQESGRFIEEAFVEVMARIRAKKLATKMGVKGISGLGIGGNIDEFDELDPNAGSYPVEVAWLREAFVRPLEQALVDRYGATDEQARDIALKQLQQIYQSGEREVDKFDLMDMTLKRYGAGDFEARVDLSRYEMLPGEPYGGRDIAGREIVNMFDGNEELRQWFDDHFKMPSLPKTTAEEERRRRGEVAAADRMKADLMDMEIATLPKMSFEQALQHANSDNLDSLSLEDLWRVRDAFGEESNRRQLDVHPEASDRVVAELHRRMDIAEEGATLRYAEHVGAETHVHTTYSDGHNTIGELVRRAHESGARRIVISDHGHYMTPERLAEQAAEIDHARSLWPDIEILKGIEANIDANGNIETPEDELAKLDWVNVGLHSDKHTNATERYLQAMENPYVRVIAHPHTSDGVDWDAVAQKAAAYGVALEVNGRDMLRNDREPEVEAMIEAAVRHGAKLQFASDAHRSPDPVDTRYGLMVADGIGVKPEHLTSPNEHIGPRDNVSVLNEPPIVDQAIVQTAKQLNIQTGQPGEQARAVLGNNIDTRQMHQTRPGVYTHERKVVHDPIVEAAVADAPSQDNPIVLVMAGGPAAGKSVSLRANPDLMPEGAVHANPDDVMEALPEHALLRGDPYMAYALHEEAADIAARIFQETMAKRANLVLDGVGDSGPGKFAAKLRQLKEAGYTVKVLMADTPTNKAIERSVARATTPGSPDEGRFVPLDILKQLYRDAVARMDEWIESSDVDEWKLNWTSGDWGDTNVHTIASGGGGSYTVHDQSRWDTIQQKRNYPSASVGDLADQEVAPSIERSRQLLRDTQVERDADYWQTRLEALERAQARRRTFSRQVQITEARRELMNAQLADAEFIPRADLPVETFDGGGNQPDWSSLYGELFATAHNWPMAQYEILSELEAHYNFANEEGLGPRRTPDVLMIARDGSGTIIGIATNDIRPSKQGYGVLHGGYTAGVRGAGMQLFRAQLKYAADRNLGMEFGATLDSRKLYDRLGLPSAGYGYNLTPTMVKQLDKDLFAFVRDRPQPSAATRQMEEVRRRLAAMTDADVGQTGEAGLMRSLNIGALAVGGAVRDDLLGKQQKDVDFVVPGKSAEELKALLSEHGRVEDLVVADRLVGVRFYPADGSHPEGIEVVPTRREVSTGAGHQAFDIVPDATMTPEQDMERRDFTINAMARDLQTGQLIDPFGGERDLKDRTLRTVSPTSFRDDPLRIVRGLRFVSQLNLTPDERTKEQMREHAAGVADVSGERVRQELDKLLMGANPQKALELARDTGVLEHMLPEVAATVGFDQESKYHDLTLDEHIFSVVQAAADQNAPLPVRLAALYHDVGKPESAWRGEDGRLHYYANPALGKQAHEDIGADMARRAMGTSRLAYPNEMVGRVSSIIRGHMFRPSGKASTARKFIAQHGRDLMPDLFAHRRADFSGKGEGEGMSSTHEELNAYEQLVNGEMNQPLFIKELALNGNDLIDMGMQPGPQIGEVLNELMREVLGNPDLNTKDRLERMARSIMDRQRTLDSLHDADHPPLTAKQQQLLQDKWDEPPTPRGIHAGRGGAGGFTTDGAETTPTVLGREGEDLFVKLTDGTIMHPPGKGEMSPLDVQVDGIGFEVKTVNADATSIKATLKKFELSEKEKFARQLNLDPALAIVVIDRKAGEAKIYYRMGLQGGRLSRQTGWIFMGSLPL